MQNITTGQTVTLDVCGAWHYGMYGTVTEVDSEREQAKVLFDGFGSIRVPVAIVLPA